jgi:hypothetical protein
LICVSILYNSSVISVFGETTLASQEAAAARHWLIVVLVRRLRADSKA